ncbi:MULTISPECIES: adenosylcobinamide-GDP ribazoletransferase [unclassified Romboutsia]|uniref:adenosylcobinamide-GDP ribazoletransferase n=1 Tax=unclassified Romboutsia TaxID=2626894 RepID=UPI00232E3969|nr:adenosylcobinamide-GDP ribazoletransferase [Romboutsia sp. 1001216sp1]MDB8806227.1 adenosylcobinamide-GDP ribazoletransferase [Romboutsia sp. 1001216sp1]MDB8808907.1 adenosylcobinamide-GDP ribazoletransferase [Romboutsia sp. 1001216sp1]MDB8811875.1 adenosylcobinamide-GDP ribazoletransferase [Romboutsia sp. 1001216sp1]MDB8817621.1 adenosylcobinamide-GDP ribazoletransferase [Romboutsia sp. 1001216sp1]MDB8820346.1 adenosylcobinamide-GDP ribazoletransferase [Romboutsia sp. 1001216sp1]
MKRFISILQFMTRIPINIDVGFDDEFHKTITYFPLVGFVLGILLFIIGTVSNILFDPFITSILVTLGSVILTGGLHIDGLGDTFDAIYSYRDKEKMLEIMKDSRLGTNSLLAIVFLILLKIGFIYSLINNNLMWTIIFMPVIGRLGVIRLTYKTVTPREKGMGNLFIGKATTSMFLTAILYTMALIILVAKFVFKSSITLPILASIIVVILFNQLFKNHIYKKIDGVTGDILGCSIELGEVIYLLYIYLIIG